MRPWRSEQSIANQIRMGILLFGISGVLITSAILGYMSFRREQRAVEDTLHGRARVAAGQIDSYVSDLYRKLDYLARVRSFTDLTPETQRNLLEALIRHNSAYELVAIADSEGDVLVSVSRYGQDLPPNISDRAVFVQTIQSKADYIGPVQVAPDTGLPTMDLAVPVRNEADEVDGVLLARVSPEFLGFVLSDVRLGRTGYAYIVDYRNAVIAQTGVSPQQLEPQDLAQRKEILDQTDLVTSRQIPYRGLLGAWVLGAVDIVHSTGWRVIVELPLSEAYASLYNMLVITTGIVIATLGAGAGLALLLSRRLVGPLRSLAQAARQIGVGDFNVRVKVQNKDELGLLSLTFNAMVERIKTREEALRESEEKYRALVENLPDSIVRFDYPGRLLFANRPLKRALEKAFGPREDGFVGATYRELGFPDDQCDLWEQSIRSVFESGKPFHTEYADETLEGPRVFDWRLLPEFDDQGLTKTVLSTSRDITDQKLAEEQIKANLAEKEILLQEIHHRVKNNLQVISSMLGFQSDTLHDERAIHAFQDSRNRIQSMAKIHEHLYGSEDLRRIQMASYIRELAHYVRMSYGMSNVRITVAVPDVVLDIEKATPCGLLVNELVANAMEHAFPPPHVAGPERAADEVYIALRPRENKLELTVRDNGAGLPEDLEIATAQTLGLRLVEMFTRQLQATLEIDRGRGKGTTFTVIFPAP